MKITEATTLAELQAYLRTIGEPELGVVRARRSCMAPGTPEPHAYHASAYLHSISRMFHGGGGTPAEAIEDALASLRSAMGITNLAYEPLNYVREKPQAEPEPDTDPYEGSFREAADNEGARIAAEGREGSDE